MATKRKILIISPGIEDGGMRGLGRVTLSLVDGLAAIGYEPYLLTGAPLGTNPSHGAQRARTAVIQRNIDHYLAEGIHSPAFNLSKKRNIYLPFLRDCFRLFLARATVVTRRHVIPTQHQPMTLRHYDKLAGFINFSLLYRAAAQLPRRFSSLLIISIARISGIDVIITASPYPLKKPLLFNRRIKIIQYVHDIMPLNILETPPGSAARFGREVIPAIRNADAVITSSVNAKDKLQALLPGSNPRVVYLPCNPIARKKTVNNISVVAKSNIRRGKYILFMSALEKRKNVARLIEAFSLIAHKTDHKLVLVGSQGYGWEEIAAALDALTPKVRERVILTGYISEDDKWSLLHSCTLVAHPAIDEGLGIPVIEALRAKKPVVATRLNSIEEFAPLGCVQYIDDPYSVYEIADKLLLCIAGQKDMQPHIRSGSAILAERFSQDAFNLRLQSLLRTTT